jgi:sulfatase modifying factor 1
VTYLTLLPFLFASTVSPEAWWSGLDAPTETAPARGVHALRLAVEGRARIAGTTFTMGSSPTDMVRAVMLCRREVLRAKCDEVAVAFRAEGVQHDVTVSTFDLDRTEVRVRDYARCVSAGVCAPPSIAPGDHRFDQPTLPVTQVRWEDAATYCAWAGGRLPTEAEWELAARGTSGRDYPWGDIYNPHLANHGAFADDETDASDGFVGLAPVGSFPDGATPHGILDMAGNAAEWVSDFFDADENGFGFAATPGTPQVNPTGPKSGIFHVIRGGSYMRGAAWIRGAARWYLMQSRSAAVGFRCAADVR